MPDLSRSKQKDGKSYCWDKKRRKFVEVQLKDLEISQVPIEIIEEFIADGFKEIKDE